MSISPTEVEHQRQRAEIKMYAERLLQTAGVKETYPTPIDRIVEAAELVKSGDLALLELNVDAMPKKLWKKLKGSFSELVSVVKAGLFTEEKTIFINPNAHSASVPFATLHECIHHILPWQRAFFAFLDDERTLEAKTRFKFEREANFGASHLLWQGGDYMKKALDMPITTATPRHLADLYGGSIHSSMRYYAENHREPMILAVVKDHGTSVNPLTRYELQYNITSQSFKDQFSDQPIQLRSCEDHVLFQRPEMMGIVWEGELSITVNGEAYPFSFFGYETPFNIFIILAPKKSLRRYGKPIVLYDGNGRTVFQSPMH